MSFQAQLSQQIELLRQLHRDSFLQTLNQAIELMSDCLQQQRPLLICGNGGSAADALHISGELVGRFLRGRKALNVICLNANVSVLTACPMIMTTTQCLLDKWKLMASLEESAGASRQVETRPMCYKLYRKQKIWRCRQSH